MSQVWTGHELKLSFRRCVDASFLARWQQLLNILISFIPSDIPDKPVWMLEASGYYSTNSFYKLINFGGVSTPCRKWLWKVHVPPKFHVFLWLVAKNKMLTRDNLSKRQHVDDPTCMYYCELEFMSHLLFECVVAHAVWHVIAEIFDFPTPGSIHFLLPRESPRPTHVPPAPPSY